MSDGEESVLYHVVVNDEERLSVWPAAREVPLGWRVVSLPGTKAEAMDYIRVQAEEEAPENQRKGVENFGGANE